jgi:endonuclease/exonuclease/phosphatase family metal-dependent hydrolase
MKVLTCNMLIDYDGQRTEKQVDIIKELNPDIILLQEVFEPRKKQLESSLVGYKTFKEFYTTDDLICLIYCKESIRVDEIVYHRFKNSFMNRGFCAIRVNNSWYVSTHLESLETEQYEKIRQTQLAEIWEFLNCKDFVLGMDSNMKGDISCPEGADDLWQYESQPTWFANRFFGYDAEARYDRIFVRNQTVKFKSIVENLFSDHDILYLIV